MSTAKALGFTVVNAAVKIGVIVGIGYAASRVLEKRDAVSTKPVA